MITLTVDLEDHLGVYAPDGRWVQNTMRILDVCAARGLKATFFTVGRATSAPALLRRIVDEGHELALHSHDHIMLTRENPQHYAGLLHTAKKDFEDITGAKVDGFRAPVFSLTPPSRWVVGVLADLGFTYSSSVIAGKGVFNGYPGAPRTPFRWEEGLIELPVPTFDIGLPSLRSALARSPLLRLRNFPCATSLRSALTRSPQPRLHTFLTIPFLGGVYLRYLPLFLVKTLAALQDDKALLWTYTHPYDVDGEEGFVRLDDGTPLWANLLLMHNRKGFLGKLESLLDSASAPPLAVRIRNLADLPVFKG